MNYVTNLKALVVVLFLAGAVLHLAKPLCLRFMAEADFVRRRNVWLFLTVAAFASPSLWLFVLVAMPLLFWAGRRDSNPVAVYLFFLHVIPPLNFNIPVVGINYLFDINLYRMLSFAILLPAAWRLRRSKRTSSPASLAWVDALLLGNAILVLALFFPYESFTNTLRRGFLIGIDVLVLYYVISRSCTSKRALEDAMASFTVALAIAAPMALFESVKTWLLYGGIGPIWGNQNLYAYLFRDGVLRSQVFAGHSLVLGYLFAVAFGFSLYLGPRLRQRFAGAALYLWSWIGLVAAYSRSPWAAAIAMFFANLSLGPRAGARMATALLAAVPIAGLILVSPVGERLIATLPFVGTVDQENVAYRGQLAQTSWELIKRNLFFGDPFFLLNMESLRQGLGIIDLVNSFAAIALNSGIVGLFFVLGPFLIGIWTIYGTAKRLMRFDPDISALGAALTATMFGTLLMMAAANFGSGLEKMFYVLTGFAAAYSQLPRQFAALKERSMAESHSSVRSRNAG